MGRQTTTRARPRRAAPRRPGAGDFDRLFWDYPARSIRPELDKDLLVRRVTAEGGWREMSLLRSRVGDDAIRDVIERTEARGLSPQRIRFWQLVLGLPARRADAWVRRAQESTWARRARRYRRSVDFDWFREDSIDDPVRLAADLRTPDTRGRTEAGTFPGRPPS